MKIHDIAIYLNVPETVVESLIEHSILPGHPSADGWETTLLEIELWYAKLNGKEWADLVAAGQINPLEVELLLKSPITPEDLLDIIESLEQDRKVKILSHRLQPEDKPVIIFLLSQAADNVTKWTGSVDSLQLTHISASVGSHLQLAFKCERALGTYPVTATLLNQKTLKLSIEDDTSMLPQREREIIQFYLAQYAIRLFADFLA
ncbi:MAG: hypothetical protein ABII96_09625 [Candidatus Zixiibacteriota bacterium]